MAALTPLCHEDWANLPDLILVQVFSYLSATDIYCAGASCKHWLQCSKTPELWRFVTFSFCRPAHRKWVKVFEQYGHILHGLTVVLNQRQAENLKTFISMLEHMSNLENINLSCLSIKYVRNSPLCGGHEFLTAFEKLLTKFGEKKERSTLKNLNLKGLKETFSDDFINNISANCPNLEYLNILNEMECSVSPYSIMNLVLQCNQLQELHLSYTNLSNDVLEALAQTDRAPLKRLTISYKGDIDHYKNDLSSKAWSSVYSANPDLKVQLKFYNIYRHGPIFEVMKPEIPVQELVFININNLRQEINIAVSYYGHMLEKLVVKSLPDFYISAMSLLNVARNCKQLRALYVTHPLKSNVINEILELSPLLRKTRDYSLRVDRRFRCV